MIVKAKNKQFNGVRYGVQFENGMAKGVDEKTASRLAAMGYEVEDEKHGSRKAKKASDKA